jgi:hypothetical protein
MESETITNTRMPSGITVDIESIPTNTLSKSTSSESGDGYFTTNGKLSYIRIGLIITILLFLGVNIFSYLGNFLQHTKEFFAPFFKNILESLGYVVTESTKDVTMFTAEGAKLGIDVAAGTIESGIDVIQGQLDIENPNKYREQQSGQQQSGQQQSGQSPFKELSASLSSALSDAEEKAEPLPDDAMSSTQRSSSGKAGYCYIGEDRGFRSCIEVKEWDTCMSGEIFPSNAICVNPSLRE